MGEVEKKIALLKAYIVAINALKCEVSTLMDYEWDEESHEYRNSVPTDEEDEKAHTYREFLNIIKHLEKRALTL